MIVVVLLPFIRISTHTYDTCCITSLLLYINMFIYIIGYNIRYVKILAPSDYLQISQIAVYGATGINLALAGTASASSSGYPSTGCISYPGGAIDGKLITKNFHKCSSTTYTGYYHSGNSGGDWWQLDLGASYYITNVVYYNRVDCFSDRAIGNIIQFLNSQQNVVSKAVLTSGVIQQFNPGTFTITYDSVYIILYTYII